MEGKRPPEGPDPNLTTRELVFEADVSSLTPFLKVADVTVMGRTHFGFLSDEGPALGGLGSAPTPLTYFTAAIAF